MNGSGYLFAVYVQVSVTATVLHLRGPPEVTGAELGMSTSYIMKSARHSTWFSTTRVEAAYPTAADGLISCGTAAAEGAGERKKK